MKIILENRSTIVKSRNTTLPYNIILSQYNGNFESLSKDQNFISKTIKIKIKMLLVIIFVVQLYARINIFHQNYN